MSERTKKFKSDLDSLIMRGDLLQNAKNYECYPIEFRKQISKQLSGDEDKIKQFIDAIPKFKQAYQAWYSEAQAIIKQVMPDRLADFVSYFDVPKGRKDITFQNYMIRDYLQGLRITRGYPKEVVVDGSAAIPEFPSSLA